MISDVLAAPQATLDQGPGAAGVARIVAGEWQRDGYLKPGKIVGVRWPETAMMTPDLRATGIPMRSLTGRLVRLAFAAGIVSLCASGIAAARDPAAPYLGMTEAQIIACAGEPHSRFKSGAEKDTLTYHYSGAGPVPAEKRKAEEKKSEEKESKSILSKFKKKKDKNWTCSASLVFENDKLVRVTFAHKGVRSPYQWQSEKDPEKAEKMRKEGVPTCTFSLPRCAPAQ